MTFQIPRNITKTPIPITGAKERRFSMATVSSNGSVVSCNETKAVEPITISMPLNNNKIPRLREEPFRVMPKAISGKITLGMPRENPLTRASNGRNPSSLLSSDTSTA